MVDREILAGMAKMSEDEFAQNAVRSVFSREMDSTAQGFIAGHLGSGASREKVIFLLRLTPEGMAARTEIRDLSLKEIALNEILCHDNLAFQTAAFLAVLGRTPEAAAEEAFLRELREEKIVKVPYVRHLMVSPEGRARGTRVAGMGRAWTKQRMKDGAKRLPGFNRVWANVHGIRQALRVLDIREAEMQAQIQTQYGELQTRLRQTEEELAYYRSREAELPGSHLGNSYKQFEDRMRGTREEIVARLRTYDAVFRRVLAQAGDRPFALDLGCGRGEMIELMRKEYGFSVLGVDSDASMLTDCEKRGLNAIQMNLVDYVYRAESESTDLISMIQVAEHLPMNLLADVLAECYRMLRPGGALILETPNPENLIIGSCNFYFDPTHVNKMPPALLDVAVEGAGFTDREIIRMHPYPAVELGGAAGPEKDAVSAMAEFFNQHADYAVVAYK